MSQYFLYNKAVVINKITSIIYFLDNKYKSDYTEIFNMISWLNIIKLYFHSNKTIIAFMTNCFCL